MDLLKIIQDIVNISQGINNTKLTQEIINLQQSVLKVVTENAALGKDNIRLQTEIDLLKKNAEIKEKQIYKDGAYWVDNDGPFCTRCFDADSKHIRGKIHSSRGEWYCPNCKTTWKTEEQLKTYRRNITHF
ncbi:Uncharacterised protein [[Clostridium] sordellii]|uniref:hypothetical protein n=1 Tax=Paraclostridium sordellii TaxID=1505 RepID=UPI0005E92E08|nr:hypothetical protein [Paeniclostridium sordellii]CEP41608.1 Uncharacterised protein [[Clostridium] sordellii] [Paeniclostridium sordellii]